MTELTKDERRLKFILEHPFHHSLFNKKLPSEPEGNQKWHVLVQAEHEWKRRKQYCRSRRS